MPGPVAQLRELLPRSVDEPAARGLLEAAGGNVAAAVDIFFGQGESGARAAPASPIVLDSDSESEDDFSPGSEEPCAPRCSPRLAPPRYHRLAAEVDVDEEAELRRLEGGGSGPLGGSARTGGSSAQAAGSSAQVDPAEARAHAEHPDMMAALQVTEAQRIMRSVHIPEAQAKAARIAQKAADKKAKAVASRALRHDAQQVGVEAAAARLSAGRKRDAAALALEEGRVRRLNAGTKRIAGNASDDGSSDGDVEQAEAPPMLRPVAGRARAVPATSHAADGSDVDSEHDGDSQTEGAPPAHPCSPPIHTPPTSRSSRRRPASPLPIPPPSKPKLKSPRTQPRPRCSRSSSWTT